jgi:hypothetical protein
MSDSIELTKLVACIDELYHVFHDYPLPMFARLGCNDKQQNARLNCLRQVSVRTLQESEGSLYYLSSDTYRGLLPKIFELIAFEDLYIHPIGENARIEGLRFSFNGHTWAAHEIASIRRYLIALWKYVLSVYPSPIRDSIEIASDIHYVEADLTPYLKILEAQCDTLEGVQHLADMVIADAFRKHLIQQDYVLPTLEKIYYAHMDTPIGEKMAFAVAECERLKRYYE